MLFRLCGDKSEEKLVRDIRLYAEKSEDSFLSEKKKDLSFVSCFVA
jgi:hypothetical protein